MVISYFSLVGQFAVDSLSCDYFLKIKMYVGLKDLHF